MDAAVPAVVPAEPDRAWHVVRWLVAVLALAAAALAGFTLYYLTTIEGQLTDLQGAATAATATTTTPAATTASGG